MIIWNTIEKENINKSFVKPIEIIEHLTSFGDGDFYLVEFFENIIRRSEFIWMYL